MMFCQYFQSGYNSSPITLWHMTYAALPKEQLIIVLLNNIKTFPDQSFRGSLWNSFSKKSRKIPKKMSAMEFRFKKAMRKSFWNRTMI